MNRKDVYVLIRVLNRRSKEYFEKTRISEEFSEYTGVCSEISIYVYLIKDGDFEDKVVELRQIVRYTYIELNLRDRMVLCLHRSG